MNNLKNEKTISVGYTVIMGMGKTGIASANFLVKQGVSVRVMDNRSTPPGLKKLQQILPEIPYITGYFDVEQLANAQEIIISPGLSRHEPALAQALAAGIPIISEIELFARYVNAPVVAITGSNGKSTVTTLLGEMAKKAGWQVQVGGNLGTPAIELLCHPAPDLYVLELSSFQLESTYSLNPKAAVILNISEDHRDRYAHISEYIAAKQTIYQGDGIVITNADDPIVAAMRPPHRQFLSFSLHDNQGDFRIRQHQGEYYFARADENSFTPLLPTKKMRLQGTMMRANALAALALGEAVGLPPMLDALQTFRGLPHRCAWVANKQGSDWFNDSKGTNVGATIAAIQSLEKPGQIILIAGGDGKGADFTPLTDVVAQHCRACVLIGKDAPLIANVLKNTVPIHHSDSMEDAVTQAATLAQLGDIILLSPACASFDMFNNYEHRGQVFEKAVVKM
ncbi:UDP-N-acetylmuramoyl-L-alanine--D-glutamate ligase [Candidatus Parabeggiatoa sp. HSG14]|uniref:UDP-N-acetylmuramoyl-L-alanine--D-glutamate ligase n=1 Tax=Candidatus Parabeggiatoa sp. HSG14 TaxID=3055593 RepID=UPI0025A80566|nr:UDP-N-acetylmuramoyl-L-alanine--D-glutamate ligase [Thiotrichales bacterium HSG14]